ATRTGHLPAEVSPRAPPGPAQGPPARRAASPMVSGAAGGPIAPRVDTIPWVAFHAVSPQQCAGIRSEPPVSEPNAITAEPLATAAADPDDDPPEIKSGFHGLRTRPHTALYPDGS